MKKKLIIGIIVAVIVIVAGGVSWFVTHAGTSYAINISDGNDVLVSGSNINISKQDYFEVLMDQYGANEVLNEAIFAIADKELEQSEIDKVVAELTETYTKYGGGDLEAYAKKLGYESKQDYIDEVIVTSAKQQCLREKYLKENLDQYIKDYQITSFKKIIVDKESTALELIKSIKNEDDFDAKMKEYSSQAEDAGLVTKNTTTLDSNLKSALEKLCMLEEDGVYGEAIKLSDETYAVVYVYHTDHQNTEDIIDRLSSDNDVQEEIEGIYLRKYQFDVYDKKLKEYVNQISDQYFE